MFLPISSRIDSYTWHLLHLPPRPQVNVIIPSSISVQDNGRRNEASAAIFAFVLATPPNDRWRIFWFRVLNLISNHDREKLPMTHTANSNQWHDARLIPIRCWIIPSRRHSLRGEAVRQWRRMIRKRMSMPVDALAEKVGDIKIEEEPAATISPKKESSTAVAATLAAASWSRNDCESQGKIDYASTPIARILSLVDSPRTSFGCVETIK